MPRRIKANAKDAARERHLQRYYGISQADYERILQEQGGGCGVCHRSASRFKTRLAVDHNHKSGEIRGLLCINCNRYVIGRHTQAELFLAAYEYLNKGTGLFVPEKRPKRRRKKRNAPRKRM